MLRAALAAGSKRDDGLEVGLVLVAMECLALYSRTTSGLPYGMPSAVRAITSP